MSLYNRDAYEYYESEKEDVYYEQISHLETNISCWTENEIEAGNMPTLEQFLDEYPEWDHDELYETIVSSIDRYINLIDDAEKQEAMRWDSLPF